MEIPHKIDHDRSGSHASVEQYAKYLREVSEHKSETDLQDAIFQWAPENAEDLIGEASIYSARGDDAQAYWLMFRAIMTDPFVGNSLLSTKQFSFSGKGKVAKSEQCLQAVMDTPDSGGAYQKLGRALRRSKRPEEAALAFRRAINLSASDGESLRNLASVMRDEGFLNESLLLTLQLLEIDPENPWAHIQHGNILAKLKNPEDAITAYLTALDIKNNARGVHRALGRQYCRLNNLYRAKQAFEAAIHVDPSDRHAMEEIATLCDRTGNHREAVIWCRRLLNLKPDSRSAKRRLKLQLLYRERWEDARLVDRWETSESGETAETISDKIASPDISIGFFQDLKAPEELTVVGLGIANRLAHENYRVICACSKTLTNRVITPAKSLTFVSNRAKDPFEGEVIDLQLSLSDALTHFGFGDPLLSPWLKPRGEKSRTKTQRIVFIDSETDRLPWPNFNKVSKFVSKEIGESVTIFPALPDLLKTIRLLKDVELVITDDGLTAIAAASIGIQSIFLVACDGDWWWADRGQKSPLAPNQTLIRMPPDIDGRNLVEEIIGAIRANGVPATAEIRPNPQLPETDPVFRDMFDRLSIYFSPPMTAPTNVEKLTGGSRNSVYKIEHGENAYILRLGKFPSPRRGFFAKENANMRIAAEAGLAPSVIFAEPLDGSMLLDFIEGETLLPKSVNRMENAIALARLYRKVHQLAGFRDRFDIFDKIRRNTDKLANYNIPEFTKQVTFNELANRTISTLRQNGVPHYASHNDPSTRNFIRHGEQIMMIDWECSGLGDPHWEIAALASQAGFNEEVWHSYMREYFGSDHHPAICRIPLFEALCRYFWWTDALCTGVLAPDNSAWQEKADHWWQRFTDIVGTKAYSSAVSAANKYRWEPAHSPASREFDVSK